MAIAMTYLRRTSGNPENSLVLYDRHGQTALRYSKVHLCWYGLEGSCVSGDGFSVAELDTAVGGLRVGVATRRYHRRGVRAMMAVGQQLVKFRQHSDCHATFSIMRCDHLPNKSVPISNPRTRVSR